MRFKNPMNREALALLSKDELRFGASGGTAATNRAPARPEQHQQRQAAVQRWTEQAAGGEAEAAAHREPAREVGPQAGRAEGPRGRDPAPSRRTRRDYRSLSRDLPELWFGIDAGAMSTGHGARQVFDLPEPRPLVVMEHRAHRCRCGRCGRQTRAAFPAGVTGPVRYGARIGAMVVYLSHYQLLPEDRLAELMADLFAVALVPATASRGWAEAAPGASKASSR